MNNKVGTTTTNHPGICRPRFWNRKPRTRISSLLPWMITVNARSSTTGTAENPADDPGGGAAPR